MVLDDIFSEQTRKNSNAGDDAFQEKPERVWREDMLASPRDRLAATVADIIVFMPIVALIVSPARRYLENAKVLGLDNERIFALLGLAFLGFSAIVAFQTIFLVLYGATPGKLALRLKVISVHSSRPLALNEAFWRSCVWCLELSCLGVPWLSLFSNERRRPWHDRIAETAVIALSKNRRSGIATLPEMSVASGFQSAVIASLLLVGVTNLNHWRKESESLAQLISQHEDAGLFCREIRETIESEHGTRQKSSIHDRLDVALSLYTLGEIDDSCVDAEADFALMHGEEKNTAYLAKGLTTSDDLKSEQYFAKACNQVESSDACRMTLLASEENRAPAENAEDRAFEMTRENQIAEIGDLLHVTGPSAIGRYLRVAVIDHWMKRHEYAKALQAMDSPQVFPGRIGARVSLERVKALWELDRKSEARVTMRAASDLLDGESRLKLARWSCFNETFADGCSSEARVSCDRVSASVNEFAASLLKPEVASAYIRAETCRMSETGEAREEEWASLIEKLPTKEAKSYAEAISKVDRENSIKELRFLSRASSSIFALEATAQLIAHANSKEDLAALENAWREASPSDEAWKLVGKKLASRAADLRAWEKAVKIGLKMVESDPHDRSIYRSLIVAAYEAGHEKMAIGLLETFKNLDRDFYQVDAVGGTRVPASAASFEQVVEALEAKAGQP